VHSIRRLSGVKGARQMGGGFGGCIITLVEKTYAEPFVREIQGIYNHQYRKIPDCYTMEISDGARIIKAKT
jgi:galactokinase